MSLLPRLLALLVAVGAQLTTPAQAATVRVTTGGVDSAGCGAASTPCATLGFALSQVDGQDDVIEISAGRYSLTEQVTVSSGGVAGAPLVIRGAGPTTILDGAGATGGAVILIAAAYSELEDLALTGSSVAPLQIEADHVVARRVAVSAPRGVSASCLEVSGATDVALEEISTASCPHRGVDLDGGGDLRLLGGEIQGASDDGVHARGVDGLRVEGTWVHHNGLTCADCAGLSLDRCSGVETGAWRDQHPVIVSEHPGAGIALKDCVDALVSHAVVIANNGAIRIREGSNPTDLLLSIDHITAVSSTGRAVYTDLASGTSLSIYNSVLAHNTSGDLPTGVAADHRFNLRFDNGGGNLALDGTELGLDPRLADLAGRDLHLRSSGGRYLPGAGWVVDGLDSPAIDAADPAAAFALETAPNGGRANLGAYGDTVEASRSPSVAIDAGLPDTALPDTARSDAALPDAARQDAELRDATGTDTPSPDRELPDAGAIAHDLAGRDLSTLLAHAGPDRRLQAPAELWLDGSGSVAPPGARFSWSLVEGPGSPMQLGDDVRVAIRLEEVGARVFELEVSADGMSDRDQLLVEVWPAQDAEAGAGCSCAMHGSPGLLWSSLMVALGALHHRRRRSLAPGTSHARPRSGASS